MSVLIFNGSPSGDKGNCQVLIQKLLKKMKLHAAWKKPGAVNVIHLAEMKWSTAETKKLFQQIKEAEGFIFTTGTYWDSWGSPLQVFLENVTTLEGGPEFLGKPAVVLVLNHSVGGKGVLSRLQGVLSTLGCMIPPMSGMVYSWVSEQVLKQKVKNQSNQDLWSLNDLGDILENFQIALNNRIEFKSWPVDKKDYRKVWLKS